MPQDYLAMDKPSKLDMVQHGVKGMHWGIIRDRATLRASKKPHPTDPNKILVKDSKTGQTHEAPRTKSAPPPAAAPHKVVGAASGETSQARYNRLAEQAKAGRANEFDEQDLKFFNARTEALAKINNLNQQDPGWLSSTTKKVLQTSAERALQNISNSVTDKYLSGPVIEALGAAKTEPSKKDKKTTD